MSKEFLCCILLMLVFALLPCCFAKNLAVLGPTYPILEEDFLQFIKKRVAAFDVSLLQQRMQKNALRYRDRPTPLSYLTQASTTKSWLWDPTVILAPAIPFGNGVEGVPAGTRINLLSLHPLSKVLVFFNADDSKQCTWAFSLDKQLQGKTTLILTGGSVLSTEKLFKKTVYFDQEGRLSSHFGIHHVPTWIRQQKTKLRITEVGL